MNGPGKILGHFMIAPNKIYKEEKPGQERLQFLCLDGDIERLMQAAKTRQLDTAKCQNKPPPQGRTVSNSYKLGKANV